MLKIGFWGHEGTFLPPACAERNWAVKAKIHELGGMRWLYVHVYQQEAEFWSTYEGREWYDALQDKYKAPALPSVYEKVHVKKEDKALAAAARQGKRRWVRVTEKVLADLRTLGLTDSARDKRAPAARKCGVEVEQSD